MLRGLAIRYPNRLSQVALFGLLLASALPTSTQSGEARALGDDFETRFWQAIRLKQWSQIEAMLAPAVLAINRGEILHGRSAVLDHVKRIDMSDFQTSDIVVEHPRPIVPQKGLARTPDGPHNRGCSSDGSCSSFRSRSDAAPRRHPDPEITLPSD